VIHRLLHIIGTHVLSGEDDRLGLLSDLRKVAPAPGTCVSPFELMILESVAVQTWLRENFLSYVDL